MIDVPGDSLQNLVLGAEWNPNTTTNNNLRTRLLNALISLGLSAGGSGDVFGPAVATDSVPALFDGITGKLLKNSTPSGTGNPVLATDPIIGRLYGSSAANGDITIEGTSSATKTSSSIILQPTGGNVGIGVASPSGGTLCLPVGSAASPSILLGTTAGFYQRSINEIQLEISGVTKLAFFGGSTGKPFIFGSDVEYGWASGVDSAISNFDLLVARDAADTLAIRRTTNPQTLHIYNTYTDASNYERFAQTWSTNIFRLGTKNAGTGTARVLTLDYGGTTSAAISIPITSGTITLGGGLTLPDAADIVVNATTGTKIGTATTQKIGFYNATPVVQGASVADASGGAVIDVEARAAINALISRIEATGLIATV